MKDAIVLTHITKSFTTESGFTTAVKDVSLHIRLCEFFILLGPSGCGKSTLLRIMCGLETPTEGLVHLDESVTRHDVSFVFQQFALLPWMSVYENVELGLVARNIVPVKRVKQVTEVLERLGLSKFTHAFPRELSGGMRQRVGIARAFVTKPKIIFMDEPFSELDSFTASDLRQELLRIWADEQPTIVMVTHIIDEALELADRIAVMTSRPGTIEHTFENKLPRPRHKRSPDFFTFSDELYRAVKP